MHRLRSQSTQVLSTNIAEKHKQSKAVKIVLNTHLRRKLGSHLETLQDIQ
jgi:hypothetical protein